MPRIIVRPEALEQVSARMQQASAEIRALAGRMADAFQSLDWEVTHRAAMEQQGLAARQSALAMADQLGAMATLLAQTAAQFREADGAGVAQVQESAARWEAFLPGVPGQEVSLAAGAAGVPLTAGLGYLVRQNPELFPPAVSYDGKHPAPGTTNQDAWIPVKPALLNGPGERSAGAYSNVLNQFAVEHNPRYAQRGGNTYCNIFVWDASLAMGAELPHWVDAGGNPVAVGRGGELNANGVYDWLQSHGGRFGWREVSGEEAQALASQGMPAVAAWHSGSGAPGHVAMIRPGEFSPTQGPAIAQAGGTNYNETTAAVGFGSARLPAVRYWVHD